MGRAWTTVPEGVAEKARDFESQDQDSNLQRSSGRFCKVRELPFQDQAPDHPGSRGVLLEWLHSRSVHASPHIPVRNPRKIHERSEAFIDPTDAAKDVVARFGLIDRSIDQPPCARRCRGPPSAKPACFPLDFL